MTTLNITLDQVDEQMKRLQEIKMFLEGVKFPKVQEVEAPRPELNLVIHEYWKK